MYKKEGDSIPNGRDKFKENQNHEQLIPKNEVIFYDELINNEGYLACQEEGRRKQNASGNSSCTYALTEKGKIFIKKYKKNIFVSFLKSNQGT